MSESQFWGGWGLVILYAILTIAADSAIGRLGPPGWCGSVRASGDLPIYGVLAPIVFIAHRYACEADMPLFRTTIKLIAMTVAGGALSEIVPRLAIACTRVEGWSDTARTIVDVGLTVSLLAMTVALYFRVIEPQIVQRSDPANLSD